MQAHRDKVAASLVTQPNLDLFKHSAFSHLDWVIFDADNTLWDLEGLYHSARDKLVRFLVNLGFDADEVDLFQRNRDLDLFQEHGRMPTRFPQSFRDTLFHFRPAPTKSELEYVLEIGNSVFSRLAEPYPGVADALSTLSKQGRIGILTAGPRDIQTRRIEQFPYMQFVNEWAVVEQKTPETFRRVIEGWRVTPHHSWMIGDSIRSDIIPARRAGLNTIFVETDNWAAVENYGLSPDTQADYSVKSVSAAAHLILQGLKLVGRHNQ